MRKATIYFNGSIILTVSFEKIERTDQSTFLTIGYGYDKRTVAIVPKSHLIVIS